MAFNPHPRDKSGVVSKLRFDNGYGVSLVKSWHTYGGRDGLFELAVLKDNGGPHPSITYDTPITSDVLGYLSEEDVSGIMEKVQGL